MENWCPSCRGMTSSAAVFVHEWFCPRNSMRAGAMIDNVEVPAPAAYWKRQADAESRSRRLYQDRCEQLNAELADEHNGPIEDTWVDGGRRRMRRQWPKNAAPLLAERDEARRVARGLLRVAKMYYRCYEDGEEETSFAVYCTIMALGQLGPVPEWLKAVDVASNPR